MNCERAREIQLYHDGELSPAQRSAVEAHLVQCADCDALLAELQGLSQAIRIAPMADLSQAAIARVQLSWRKARDRGVLHVAEWLTAAAAAVLFATLLVHPSDRDQAAAAPVWQTVAVMPPTETRDESSGELTVVAQWMADDLSSGEAVK